MEEISHACKGFYRIIGHVSRTRFVIRNIGDKAQ